MTKPIAKNDETGLIKLPNIKDNFGLTQSEFKQYVAQLHNGDESLFTQVFKEHFHDSVAYLTHKFKIAKHEAYDSCMDTLLEFRKKILSGKIQYGNLRFLFTRMALNNQIKGYRNNQKVDEAIQVFMNDSDIDGLENEMVLNILDQAITKQSEKDRQFIKIAFYSKDHLTSYAENNGLNYASLRKQKQRTLTKLKQTFFEILNREKQS